MSASKKTIFENAASLRASNYYPETKAKCLYHKDLDLTNFCRDLDCLMPLCPECMKSHLEMHKRDQNYGDIERIDTVLEESLVIVDKLLNFYKSDVNNIENLNSMKRDASRIISDKITQAKNKIYLIVENFFATFAQEAHEIFSKQQSAFFTELETSKKFLSHKIDEIEKFKLKLRNPKTFIKSIIRLNSTTLYSENFNYHKEVEQYIDVLLNKLVQPVIDESKLYSFNLELAKFVYLKNAEIYKEEAEEEFLKPPKPQESYNLKPEKNKKIAEASPQYKSFKDDLYNVLEDHNKKMAPKSPEKRLLDLSNMTAKPQNSFSKGKDKDVFKRYTPLTPLDQKNVDSSQKKKTRFSLNDDSEYQPSKFYEEPVRNLRNDNNSPNEIPNFSKYSFNKDPPQKSKPILKKTPGNPKEIALSAENYFSESCNFKYLHYFQPKIKRIFLYNLQNPSNSKMDEVDLNIPFTIPENSRSLITPYGDIYLSGGTSNEKKGRILNSLYKFNKYQKNLSMKNPMNFARNAHGFIFFDDFLYACGGMSENDETLDSCEKYDIRNEKWINIAKMVKKSSYFTLISYSNKSIFKFGGVQNSNSIERYDISSEKWSEVNFFCEIKNFIIPSLCGAGQINENEILVFGGVENHSEVRKSFIFRINEETSKNPKFYITDVNTFALPFEGFVDTGSLVEDGCLYSLLDSLKETSMNSKFLMAFNGRKWSKIV